jgi:membrane dipeptidase
MASDSRFTGSRRLARRLIIDSHLDLAWNALGWGRDLARSVSEINALEAGMTRPGRRRATTSLPEMRRAGVAVCLATVIARVKPEACFPPKTQCHSVLQEPGRVSLDYPNHQIACAAAQGQLAYYRLLEGQGEVRFLRSASELDAHWHEWRQPPHQDADKLPVGIILAMEGADPIVEPAHSAGDRRSPTDGTAEAWFRDGLRSVSLAHYGKSRYAVGTGESGPLTEDGIRLLKELGRLGVILDVTHLAEPGFCQALDRFDGPVMASHNNCRALVPGDRQFSDEQIKRLIERDAVIGVALDAWMLYPGWKPAQTSREVVGLEAVVDHVDHVCRLAGDSDHVGIGSDLDGGYGTEQTPVGLDTIADLQKLGDLLAARDYRDEQIDAIFHGNWLRFFRRHLRDQPS